MRSVSPNVHALRACFVYDARVPRLGMSLCTRWVFVLHFHQPFGNLDAIVFDAALRCYEPTLDLLLAFPHVRAGIHVSGTLLQWFARKRPEVLDKLCTLSERGQVEIIGGTLEEAVPAMLPERDSLGQLVRMADLCEALFGLRPRGMWLAERVWEPDLPRVIVQAGYRYTLLDDTHLFAAGVLPKPQGYYVTEKAGCSVAVLPIDRELRSKIPFASVDALLQYLYGARGSVLTYGDDVEKFGFWPATQRRVWHEGWLRSLFSALWDNREWLLTVPPSEVLKDDPSGLIYLPSMAYPEMDAWCLPAETAARFADVAAEIDKAGLRAEAEPFLRGGQWMGFMAKYSESRRMYRKMLRVSQMVEDARARGDQAYEAARAALYRGQANNAYWHGWYGGLYVGHLRSAVNSSLLSAELLLSASPEPSISTADHDTDFFSEVRLEAAHVNVEVQPSQGGRVSALEIRSARYLLTDVLGERFEAYHRDIPDARVMSDDEFESTVETTSVHDIPRAVEPDLVGKLQVDAYERGAFVDHLLPAGADLRALTLGIYAPLVNLPNTPFSVEVTESGSHGAQAILRGERDGIFVRKDIAIDRDRILEVRYEVSADGPKASVAFASETAFTLQRPEHGEGRRLLIEADGGEVLDVAPGSVGTVFNVRKLRLVGESLGVDAVVDVEPAAELWRFPLETVSRGERGFEASYQGTVLVFVWRGEIGEGSSIAGAIRWDFSGCRKVQAKEWGV